MALDPHPDREPGMDARVLTPDGLEYARSVKGTWEAVGDALLRGFSWQTLATLHPDATVVLP